MARDLNKVMLIGRLGADPEMKVIPSGSTVVNFNLATGDSYKDKTTGNTVDKTEWHRVVVWDKLAEICKQYLKKGSQVYVEGRMQTRNWDDKETGKKNYITEIVCTDMQMLGSKNQMSSGGEMSEEMSAPPQHDAPQHEAPSATPKATAPKAKPAASAAAPEKDDLPF
jgi:single-strand DNA-binding protein